MKKRLAALSISTIVIFLNACSKQESGYADYWQKWGDEQLNSWNYDTEIYDAQVKAFCDYGGSRQNIRSSFLALSAQWAALNGFPYHAITDFNLGFELYAWPDKRNMTEARLGQRITSGGISESELETATASEKGLLALEWLTFSDLPQEEICSSLSAVSTQYRKNIKKIAKHHLENPLVVTEWLQDRKSTEGNSIALNLLFQQIGQISNRLRTSINEDGEIIPILSEGWRSNTTTEIYATSLGSILSHLGALREKADISVNSEGLLEFQIKILKALSDEMQLSIQNKSTFDSWIQLQQAIIDTKQLIEGPIAQDVGILIGFNNYDGD